MLALCRHPFLRLFLAFAALSPVENCPFCSSVSSSSPSPSDLHRTPLFLHNNSLLTDIRRCVHPGTALFKWPNECHIPQLRSRLISLDSFSQIVFAEQRHCPRRNSNWTVQVKIRCSDGGQWKNAKMEIIWPQEKEKLRSLPKRWIHRRNPRISRIRFKEDKYVVEIPENAPVQSVVVHVQAHSEADQPLYYAFGVAEDTRSSNLFSLDSVSGEVKLVKSLDREMQQKHVLKVMAFERLDPSQTAAVSVIVEVSDVQDNAPSFEKGTYVAEIRENAPIGTTVLSVFARDFDEGANGEVKYSLENVNAGTEVAHLFSINPKTGVVYTAAQLDHESLSPLLLLQAIATDGGQPPMRSNANLEIAVLDVNDNAPQFEQPNGTACETSVPEDAPVPSVILRPRTRDADSGANGKVHFSIISMSAPLFSIDYESGEVTLRSRASPKQSPLSLLIRAKDGGQPSLFATLQCTVRIIDVNDHSPAFVGIETTSGDQLELFVDENAPIGREIGRLLAVDEDSGENGEIRYRIAPPAATEGKGEETDKMEKVATPFPFEMDAISGALRTTQKLDRESRAEFILNILAEDGGAPPKNASLQIKLHVKDINDNSPFFPQTFYQIELDEDTPRGHSLLALRANDADENDSQKLTYRIVRQTPSANDLFALTNVGPEQDAVLSLARQFSPKDEEFLLEISATDEDGLSGHCNVSIKIRDVNRPPQFTPHQFLLRIAENASIGAPVSKMEATDEDRGANARLTFSMNSTEFGFGIDSQNGLVTVRAQLDREKQAMYSVEVRVQDGGNPSLSATTPLEIALDDVNDNVPRFLSVEYRVSVPEDVPVGTSILQVQAQDPDEGPNGQIDYLFDSDDPFVRMGRFRLDRMSGIVRVDQSLDRENVSKFLLPLIASDRGTPRPLSARTLVEVVVEDVNDNAPNFEFSSYEFYVSENSPVGTLVGELRADDADLDENGHIEFRIFGGMDAKFFELDREQTEERDEQKGTVRIWTRQQFDFEATQNKFTIELQASSGQLSTTVPIRVHILDVNDHPPQLADPLVILMAQFVGDEDEDEEAPNAEWPGLAQNRTIGQVPAFDPDQNATLEFAIEQNALIEVEPQSGILTLINAKWKRQIDAVQQICVSDGPNTVCARALFHLVSVSAEMLRSRAVSVFLEDTQLDELLDVATFLRFLEALSSLWEWAMPENFRVFGVEEKGRKSSNGTELAGTVVNLFVTRNSEMDDDEDESSSTISSWLVEDAIEENRANLSILFGALVHLERDGLCASEPCPYFQRCRSALRFLRTQETLSTDNFVFRPIFTLRTFNCECPRGFITNSSVPGKCNQRLNQCFNGPCLHGGTCHAIEDGFRCSCPTEWTGERCELATFGLTTCLPGYCFSGAQCQIQMATRSPLCAGCPWRPIDTDERCRLRAVSFGGDSFLALPKAPSRLAWSLSLSLATISHSGTLIFSGSVEGDFLHLSLEGGVPRIEFSLGDDSLSAKLDKIKPNFVNDGEWHSLELEYSEWKLRLSVDNCDVQSSLLLGTLSPKCAVEVTVPLTKKCLLDFAVPCRRFLDLPKNIVIGGIGRNIAKKFASALPFVGVVKDLRLDGQLAHFSNWAQLERVGPNIWPGAAKFRPDYCHQQRQQPGSPKDDPCPGEHTKCLDRWLGHHCRCHFRVHSPRLNCTSLHTGHSDSPALTLAEDSFAVWRLPSAFSLPFSLSFEFRTRERKSQVIALDFEQSAQMLIFSLENGQSLIRVNSEQYLLPFPATLSDGNWHAVEAHFTSEAVEIGVDVLYKKSIPLMALSTPLSLRSGTVPASANPAAFLGCLRNVEWNGQRLFLANQSATRQSCLAPNVCQMASTQCPAHSKCVRDWDRHNCKCDLGFVGDSCVHACSLPDICGPFPNAICVRSPNSARGYECICPEGRIGPNCENGAIPSECPEGWFGQFPRCKRCLCPPENGFAVQCNPKNGQCICQEGTFLTNANESNPRCAPCHCGYGTAPGELVRCDRRTGQCDCIGDAVGRQCDRCEQKLESKSPLLLERRSLKCVPIDGRCPSQMEMGVQWPTTSEGSTARQSCAHPMMGIATRVCSQNGIWAPVNDFNCTLPSLFTLQNRIFEFDTAQNAQLFDLSRRLLNLTRQNWQTLSGKNVKIVLNLLNELMHKEMANNGTELAGIETVESARSNHFTRNLLRVADILLDVPQQSAKEQAATKQLELATNLANYGAFLAHLFHRYHFIRPFKFGGKNLVFAIDQIVGRSAAEGEGSSPHSAHVSAIQMFTLFADARIHFEFANSPTNASSSLRLFYAFANLATKNVSPIFCLSAAQKIVGTVKLFLTIALPIAHSFGSFECLAKFAHQHWHSVPLLAVNRTHFQCQIALQQGNAGYHWQKLFPLMVRAVAHQQRSAAGIMFFPFAGGARAAYSTPYSAIPTICTMFTVALLVVAFALTLCRKNYGHRLLRCASIGSFVLNVLSVQMFIGERAVPPPNDNGLWCASLLSLLAASFCALFAFLLLYSLHLCKMVLQNVNKTCQKRHVTFGLILPLLIGVGELFLSMMHMNNNTSNVCHVSVGSAPFYLLTVPSAILCLLNFYSLATSWLLSWHKQYQLAVLRFSVRRRLFSHFLLILLCAILLLLHFVQLFRPFPSQFLAILTSLLSSFIAIHFFLWAIFFITPLKEGKNTPTSSANSEKSVESTKCLARDTKTHQTAHQRQLMLMGGTEVADGGTTNFYANSSSFRRGISPFGPAKRRPRLTDGKIYEAIPNGGGEGDAMGAEEAPTFVHHTLQRSAVDLLYIVSPHHRWGHAPPNSLVDGNWPFEEEEERQRHHRFLTDTLPIGGGAPNFVQYSQIHKPIELKRRPLHYGSVHAIDRAEMTPNARRRRTQPIQMTGSAEKGSSLTNGGTESPRNRKFGPGNLLDDELNCAYFTFTRRRDQTMAYQKNAASAATTFN